MLQDSSSYSVRSDLASLNIILYWTKYFDRNHFGAGMGSEPFEKGQCNLIAPSKDQTRKCWTTNDRSLFNSSLAVLFHARDIDPDDLPPTAWRRPEQHFIFFNYESPVHTDLARLRLHLSEHFFNLSMTYRLDSDIVILQPYGRLRCIRQSDPGCRDYPFIDSKRSLIKKMAKLKQGANYSAATHLARRKNGTVAWFVSNCRTDSRRELLVRNLSLFIPVDIFGSCKSNKKCGPDRADCDRMLSRYHFYLSLENSLCPDYLTEKLYRALVHGTIPVIYGGADYTRFLPAGSYVNAVDFGSPQELANRLLQVMNDDQLYASYFQWKKLYRVDSAPLDGWCRLCRLLQSGNNNSKKSYKDIVAWWSGYSANQSCSNPPVSLVGHPPYEDDESYSTKSSNLYRLFNRFHQFLIPK